MFNLFNWHLISFINTNRANKRYLKIKNVNEDDTGVFVCKGINGFGSDTVRVELIIVGELRENDNMYTLVLFFKITS